LPEHSILPTVNALLNTTSAVLLILGGIFIWQRKIAAHRTCMLGAVAVSAVFLASYIYYHFNVGSVRFTGQGWARPVYFTILLTHTVLAVAVLPLVLVTVWRALRGSFDKHKRVARWTYPIWMYVSVTGVVIYLMLYHFFRTAS
jgi:putative membrane protein